MFCVSVKHWLHSDTSIWAPFLLDPEDVRCLSLGAIWNFSKETGHPCLGHEIMSQKGLAEKA
jgi:hypothetical protein